MAEKKMIDMSKAHAQIMDSFITAFETVLEQIENQCAEEKPVKWISAYDNPPNEFVPILGHMTDATGRLAVRECYLIGNFYFFPTLREIHPIDFWMPMPDCGEVTQ